MPFSARAGFTFQPILDHPNPRVVGASSTNDAATWSRDGSPVTKTAIKRFGTASGFSPSSSERIELTADIFPSGTGDFTFEFWLYIETLSGHDASCDLFAANPSPEGGIGVRLARQFNEDGLSSANPKYISLFARQQADLDQWTLPTNWPINTWHFMVIQRRSGVMSCWYNGTLLPRQNGPSGTGTASGRNYAQSSYITLFDASSYSGAGPIYIDEFCVSKSFARYADTDADIPVPTAPFTVDEYTSHLLHMDGDNDGTTFTNDTGS